MNIGRDEWEMKSDYEINVCFVQMPMSLLPFKISIKCMINYKTEILNKNNNKYFIPYMCQASNVMHITCKHWLINILGIEVPSSCLAD